MSNLTTHWGWFTRRLAAAVVCLAWLIPAWAQPVQGSARNRLREVIVVFKTHFDIGFTDMADNVVQRYRTTMIDDAVDVVEQNRSLPPERQFTWTLPGWPLSKILEDWPGQRLRRQQRIRQALREGHFVVHALPFTTHTESLELEDLVRGLSFASRLSRDQGLALPRDAKMTDVACHTWLLPTLLKHAGVDFFHLGSGSYCATPEVPLLAVHVGYHPSHAAPPAGKLPPSQAGLELSRRSVLVTAFGKNPDGEGTLLRLWELAGKSEPCRVHLPGGLSVTSVQPVNLRGEPSGKPIAVENSSFTIELGAFAPASVVWQTKREPTTATAPRG